MRTVSPRSSPFSGYSRKDRQTQPRDPVTTRYVARLFEAVGVDRIVTLDVHNLGAFQNAFRCETAHLDARRLFAEFFADRLADREVIVVSPDVGGTKRAEHYREALERQLGEPVALGFIEKRRSLDVVSGHTVVGEVGHRTVLLFDDMISGGTTLARAASACRDAGAREIVAAATHRVFVPDASQKLADAPIDQIAIPDHIPPSALDETLVKEKLWMLVCFRQGCVIAPGKGSVRVGSGKDAWRSETAGPNRMRSGAREEGAVRPQRGRRRPQRRGSPPP